ncbi:MAG: FxDxF family PEP-CTERM protein [Caulobacteraceae bacterium]
MKTKTLAVAAAGLAAASIVVAVPASAATIITNLGVFSSGQLGTIPTTVLKSKNSYYYTFTLAPGSGDLLSEFVASLTVKKVDTQEPIQFSLYSGSPGSGTFVGQSLYTIAPALTESITSGNYYLHIDQIAANKELSSGSLQVSGIPEPAAWTLMLAGFGGLGAALRGSRRKQASAAA